MFFSYHFRGKIFNRNTKVLLAVLVLSAFFATAACAAEVLFVVGSHKHNKGDRVIKAHLEKRGLSVTVQDDDMVQAVDAQDKDLILISKSVKSDKVGAIFADAAIPVICAEPWLFDDLGMTGPAQKQHYGVSKSQRSMTIINPDHPLAASLSETVRVGRKRFRMGWGLPGEEAITIAALPNDPVKYPIFAYESGAQMAGGFEALEKRVGLFIGHAATKLRADGWALLDAAIDWSLGVERLKALLVVGHKRRHSRDHAIKYNLEQNGYAVTIQDDRHVQAEDADGQNLVVISESVKPQRLTTMFRDVAVPVICLEPKLYDDLAMTGSLQSTDFGRTGRQKRIKIIDPDHPLAGSLADDIRISYKNVKFGWGVPAENADRIATLVNDPDKYAIFAYDTGVEMYDGHAAPARRIGFLTADSQGRFFKT